MIKLNEIIDLDNDDELINKEVFYYNEIDELINKIIKKEFVNKSTKIYIYFFHFDKIFSLNDINEKRKLKIKDKIISAIKEAGWYFEYRHDCWIICGSTL